MEAPWKTCVWHGCEQAVRGCSWCATGTAATNTAGGAGAVRVLPSGFGFLSCEELLSAGKNAWSRVLWAPASLSMCGEPPAAGFCQPYLGVQSGSKELRLSVPWGAVGLVQAVNTNT